MKLTIQPPLNQLRFEELILEVAPGTLPATEKGAREIVVIRWDGEVGSIEYKSAVAGVSDFEHFADPAAMQTYLSLFRDAALAVFDAEQAKLDALSAALKAQTDLAVPTDPPLLAVPIS